MEGENIYDKIQEIFGGLSGQFNILEEKIDIDLQMEYFECSKSVKGKLIPDKILEKKDLIFDDEIPEAERKNLFAELASLESVEAYRTIEKYIQSPRKNLRNWAILALQESRMLLESKLLDENQVFISTGLGGKGSKLRYFVVIILRSGDAYSNLQKRVIKNEFELTLKKYGSELEQIDFTGIFATLLAMVPLQITIKDVFREAIKECNLYGNFLKTNFIVTNVKELSVDEIQDFLHKQKLTDNRDL